MKHHLKAVNTIQEEIRAKRSYDRSYTKLIDITRIFHAKQTGEWSEVYSSSLYRLHGGEYCELLSVIHRYTENNKDWNELHQNKYCSINMERETN
jgi:hypothetical protein